MAFINDILIFSRNVEKYKAYIRVVLERLREYSLYVKLSKYEFSITKVSFLGYRVGAVGVSINPSRVEVIKD